MLVLVALLQFLSNYMTDLLKPLFIKFVAWRWQVQIRFRFPCSGSMFIFKNMVVIKDVHLKEYGCHQRSDYPFLDM